MNGAKVAVEAVRAARDELARLPVDGLDHHELLAVLDELETLTRRLPVLSHRILARLSAESNPVELGGKTLRDVLTTRLRISREDARRRLGEAEDLGPRTGLTGEPLPPHLEHTARAQAAGRIGADHVRVIRAFVDRLPTWVDDRTRQQAEADLVRNAVEFTPEELRVIAHRLMTCLDQDGPAPDDAERARRRGLWFGPQGADGMTPVRGVLDPAALATWQAIAAKWAAPGMCDPQDEKPCLTGTPTREAIAADARTVGQRNHDAFVAIGLGVLSSGELGRHNGLPVSIVVSTTLDQLTELSGCAVTGGGALLPIREVIRLAARARHYLVVFDGHTARPLYLGRSRRLASEDQRIVLLARDRGCTRPGCTAPGYACQAHHATAWATDGRTDADELVLACPGDNRLADEGHRVRVRADGSVEWIPPPGHDVGQARVNVVHHPERMLMSPDTG